MKYILIIMFLIFTNGCGLGPAHYMQPPDGAIESGSGPAPVQTNAFEVNSESYPTYHSIKEFMPPAPVKCSFAGCHERLKMKISPTDTWQVTHTFKDKYLIQSKEYMQRYCIENNKTKSFFNGGLGRLISGECATEVDKFAIYIDPKGSVDGGWEVLFMKEMYFSPSKTETDQWEKRCNIYA